MTGDPPPGWAWATVDDLCDVVLGQSPPGGSYNGRGEGTPFFQGKAEFGDRFPSIRKWTTEPKKHAPVGSILLSVRAPVGPTNVAPVDCAIGRGLAALRPLGGVSTGYLLWAVRQSVGNLIEQATGSTFEAITGSQLRSHRVAVAPLVEQERIVAAIEEHFSRLDAVELGLQRGLQQLDTLKSAVLVEAFHASRGLPSHWNWTTIGEVAEVRGGIQKQPKRRPNKNPAPFLRVANVLRGELLLDEVHQIEVFDGELQKYRLQAGDLLVVEGNGSPQQIGRAACWEGEIADCVHQNHLIRVRPGPNLVPRYLALYWNAPHTASVLREVASSTSGLYTLSTAKVKSIPIPLAPLPEQQRIAEEVDQQLEAHRRLEQSIRHALDRLRAVRRSILALAFSGQLVAQDPDDEPASVLLERVAASRTAKPDRQKGDARAAARSR